MSCEGAKVRRDGLIADMTRLRSAMSVDRIADMAIKDGCRTGEQITMYANGFLTTAIDRLAAAVIALAGSCCDDCDDEPKQGWSNPDHDIMADLRKAYDGILADRDGASDE